MSGPCSRSNPQCRTGSLLQDPQLGRTDRVNTDAYVMIANMLFGELGADELYLYHYTSAQSLAKILDSASLRFGPYGSTNDPRESKAWLPSFSVPDGREVSDEEFALLLDQADLQLRGAVHLGCFTLDRQPSSLGVGHHWRGFGRARMWDQYAVKHEGACLVFDFRRLTDAVELALQETCSLSLRRGKVNYIDEDLGLTRLNFSLSDLDEQGIDSACKQYLELHWRELLLTKNSDWATENEYRYLILGASNDAIFVPIRSALVALVLGDAFPSTEASVLALRLARLQCATAPAVAICHWRNGVPYAYPFEPDAS